MKYKEGDKVRIKSLGWYNENRNKQGNILTKDGACFNEEMSRYCGQELAIDKIGSNGLYRLFLNGKYWFSDEMLEMVNPSINVYMYGDAERGDEVINMLEERGGKNTDGLSGKHAKALYCISPLCNTIVSIHDNYNIEVVKHGRTELKLPENPKFKDGDIVSCRPLNVIAKIGCVDFIICENGTWVKRQFKEPLISEAEEDDFATPEEAEIYHKVVDLNIKNWAEPKEKSLVLFKNSEDEKWIISALVIKSDFGYRDGLYNYWKLCIPFCGNEDRKSVV